MQEKVARLEKELNLKTRFIETVLENLPIGIGITQYSSGKLTFVNKKFEEIYGWPKKDIMELGTFFRNVYPDPQIRRTIRKQVLEDTEEGDPSKMKWSNLPVTTKAGKSKIASGISIPIFDQDLVIGVALDHTDSFNTLKELKESEERYRAIFDRSFDGIMICDLEGRLIDVNQVVLNVLGYEKRELQGIPIEKLITRKQHQRLKDYRSVIVSKGFGGQLREFDIITKKGDERIVEIRGALIFKNNRPSAILVLGRDITDRKKAETELNRKVASLKQAEQIAKLGYYEKNIVTGEIYRSDGYYKLMGVDPAAVGDKDIRMFDYIHEDDRDNVDRAFQQRTIEKAFVELTFRLVQKTGKIITVHFAGRTTFDENGRPLFNTAVYRDISDEKRMEEQLRQSQKMESIGTLAGGIAHDFNNILSIIIGNTDLALEDISPADPVKEFIIESRNAGLRGKEVVRQLLNFSRKTDDTKATINMSQTIRESLKLLRSSIPSSIRIHQNIDESCHPVNANETQVHQIMINLCTNAADAMADQGRIDISLSNFTVSQESAPHIPALGAGEYVRLTVCDTGHGMDEETKNRIFDPYFTTKEIGRGTGMGLSVVHGIVASQDGVIHVESVVGRGTCFEIYLPASQGKIGKKQAETDKLPKGSGRILLVDDEEHLMKLGEKILARYGYTVTGFEDPRKALKSFQAHPDAFDLVVTDLSMPDLTGAQLSRKIQAVRPIPVILCSGYNDMVDEKTGKEMGIQAFLLKPVDVKLLVKTVGDVLEDKA